MSDLAELEQITVRFKTWMDTLKARGEFLAARGIEHAIEIARACPGLKQPRATVEVRAPSSPLCKRDPAAHDFYPNNHRP